MGMANLMIPDGMAQLLLGDRSGEEMPRWAMEAILVEAVREGRISRGYFRDLLGLGFTESEELLASKGVVYDLSFDELGSDLEVAMFSGSDS